MKTEHKMATVEKCKDSGLALVLICLICFHIWKLSAFIILATLFLLVAMTYPPIFKPFAKFWFALSTTLGTFASKIILTILFFVMVLPVTLLRRLMGKDSMQIKRWKTGNQSVFRRRDHCFSAEDLKHPY